MIYPFSFFFQDLLLEIHINDEAAIVWVKIGYRKWSDGQFCQTYVVPRCLILTHEVMFMNYTNLAH